MMIRLSAATEFDLPQTLYQHYPYPKSALVKNELLGKDPLLTLRLTNSKAVSPRQLKLAYKNLADIAEE